MAERPIGIQIVAVFLIISGILGVIWTLFFSGLSFSIEIPLLILYGPVHLLLAWGIWSLKSWALNATKALTMTFLIVSLFSYQILSFIIYTIIFWYLFQPQVKSAFK